MHRSKGQSGNKKFKAVKFAIKELETTGARSELPNKGNLPNMSGSSLLSADASPRHGHILDERYKAGLQA